MNFFVSSDQIKDNQIYIKESDVNHIKNVLRKKIDDVLDVVSNGIKYKAKIVEISQDVVRCEILNEKVEQNSNVKITIFQGLAKADKIEYIIQKCTELGVYEIVPVEMKRCVVKLDEKDKAKKLARWQKIAEVASKQSLRNDILKIDKIMSFKEMKDEILKKYDHVIVAYEKEEKQTLKNVLKNINNKEIDIAVIIGPEGGIDEDEYNELINAGVSSITLGKRILRTETAPVVVSAIIMYELEFG